MVRVQTMGEMEEAEWLQRSPRDSRRGMVAHMALVKATVGLMVAAT